MATKQHGSEIKATNLSNEDRAFIEECGDQLADSTKRAKWIHAPDEQADRDGQTLATREHAVIQAWAEERGGVPATVPGTEHDGRPGVLRFKFDDENDRIAEIAWDEWFRTFDERNLVFLFQQTKADGNRSTFFRLDNPDREDA
jgi:hypothetical protein